MWLVFGILGLVLYFWSFVFLCYIYVERQFSLNLWVIVTVLCPVLNTLLILMIWAGNGTRFFSLSTYIKEFKEKQKK